MTREMNKPDWHYEWYTQNTVEKMAKMMCRCDFNSYKKPRTLNPAVAEFVESLNRSLGKCR